MSGYRSVGLTKGLEEDVVGKAKEGLILLEATMNNEPPRRPRILHLPMELRESHICRRVGGLHT